jgi:hypothetical protein
MNLGFQNTKVNEMLMKVKGLVCIDWTFTFVGSKNIPL